MGRAEYFDPTTQSRKPIKAGSIVSDAGLEYTPDQIKVIDNKIGILNGVGETKEKANKVDLAAIQDEVNSHKAESTQQAHLAKNIGLEDTTGNFVATEIEGAMSELFTNVSSGKSLVGGAITDVDESIVIPTEPTFGDLASAIGNISTGKKWASGTINVIYETGYRAGTIIDVSSIDFKPSFVMFWTRSLSLVGNPGGGGGGLLLDAPIIKYYTQDNTTIRGTYGIITMHSSNYVSGSWYPNSEIYNIDTQPMKNNGFYIKFGGTKTNYTNIGDVVTWMAFE